MTWWRSTLSWLQDLLDRAVWVATDDPDQLRRGRFLNSVVLLTIGVMVAVTVLNVTDYKNPKVVEFVGGDLAIILILGGVWLAVRRGYVRNATLIMIGAIILAPVGLFGPEQLMSLGAIFVLPIWLSALLLAPWAAFVTALISIALLNLQLAHLQNTDLGYLLIFNYSSLLIIALIAYIAASLIESALGAERRRTHELEQINAQLDLLVGRRTQDLAEALGREHAEAKRRETILLSIADGVVVFSTEGIAELANPSLAVMLQCEVHDLIGKTLEEMLKGLDQRQLDEIVDVILGRGPTRAHFRIEFPPSSEKVYSISFAAVTTHDGGRLGGESRTGMVAVFHDISREVELERMKSDFVSMAAHELRTPMTSIKGYLDLMPVVGTLSDQQKHFIEIVQTNVGRLASLVNDLLDVSRIESGRMEIQPMVMNLPRLVRQVTMMLEGEFEKKGLGLVVDVPEDLPPVFVDERRVTQVLINLVGNAQKYTPKGHVTVTARRMNDYVQVDIADTGLGISPAGQARLFTPFYRVRTAETDQISGTGLGLSIVKSLVELQGGQIWLVSEEGKGSTFSFTMPVPEDLHAGRLN